jgi:hypothetical protein
VQTWREEQKVDEIVATVLPRGDEFKKIWQNGVHGFGKDGNLIYVDRVGQVDPSKLMGKNGFAMEDVVKFHVRRTAQRPPRTRRCCTSLTRVAAASRTGWVAHRLHWAQHSRLCRNTKAV